MGREWDIINLDYRGSHSALLQIGYVSISVLNQGGTTTSAIDFFATRARKCPSPSLFSTE